MSFDERFVAAAVLFGLPSARALSLSPGDGPRRALAGSTRPARAHWIAEQIRSLVDASQAPPSPPLAARAPEPLAYAPTTPAARVPALLAPVAVTADALLHAARAEAESLRDTAREAAESLRKQAHAEAATIRAEAAATVEAAIAAGTAARAAELAARLIALDGQARALERQVLVQAEERVLQTAAALAEALVGEAISMDPARIAPLVARAIATVVEAREIRVVAAPEDVPALTARVGDLVAVEADASLSRGSLTVYTDRGTVDARLSVQLQALLDALRR